MKKILLCLVLVLVVAGILPTASHAAPASEVSITGHMYDARDATYYLAFADVEVLCQGIRKTTVTSPLGDYLVTFTSAECPEGSTVKVAVVAASLGVSGSTWVTLHGLVMKVNIAAIPTIAIPEYGWPVAVLAAGASAMIILYARREKIVT